MKCNTRVRDHIELIHYGIILRYVLLGGILESNEIFNNKFSGICLASGVKPQLSSKFMLAK